MPAGLGHLLGGQRHFPGSGNTDHIHRAGIHAIGGKTLTRASDQHIGNTGIPARSDDRKAGIGGGAKIAFVMAHGLWGLEGWGSLTRSG